MRIYHKLLSPITKMLNEAYLNHYAIGHFNINNLEWTKVLIETAQNTRTPIILGVSEGAIRYMGGYKNVVNIVNNLLEFYQVDIPIALHLDHGQSVAAAKKAIDAGFSSVMYDGSALNFEENYQNTKTVLEYAKKHEVSVEAEVGAIGGEEDDVINMGVFADLNNAIKMGNLGIAVLAAGIGNIHGKYPKNWPGLNFNLLFNINRAILKPLVLHGGSGIPTMQIEKAIKIGICKINVNTECQVSFSNNLKKYYKLHLDMKHKGYDPRIILKYASNGIKDVFIHLTKLFNSYNKAKKVHE